MTAHRETPRVYVRHRGRRTAAQGRALETLAPRYLLDGAEACSRSGLAAAFGRQAPLVVEIGFGNGSALAAFAKAQPGWNCLGVDVYQPGLGALMLACEREELDNVRIVAAEGSDLLARLAAGSVQRLHVYFPDPWPKKRHHKRRLVDAAFASRAAACLAACCVLRLATDWPDYAEQMRTVLDAEPALAGGPAPRPRHRPQTPFETKAIAQGREVFEFRYERRGGRPAPSDEVEASLDSQDNKRWAECFAKSQDVLAVLAAQAEREDEAGLTEELDPDAL